MTRRRFELTDDEWLVIEPLLPNKPRGVPRVDDRRVSNGILWRFRTASPWADIPERYGPHSFVRWRKAGVWDRLLEAVMPGSRSLHGSMTTTGSDRTRLSVAGPRRCSPPNGISNGLLRYAFRAPLRSPLLQPPSCATKRLGSNPIWREAGGHVKKGFIL